MKCFEPLSPHEREGGVSIVVYLPIIPPLPLKWIISCHAWH